MRDLIQIFEKYGNFDADEDDRLTAIYDRERKVTAIITDACQKAGIDFMSGNRPIMYDEEDQRSAIIRIDGTVSLAQLEALKPLGSNFVVGSNSGTSNGYGVQIEFNVSDAVG
jgi:hypothetical protein